MIHVTTGPAAALKAAFKDSCGVDAEIRMRPARLAGFDWQCDAALRAGGDPLAAAARAAEAVSAHPAIAAASASAPGFVNLRLDDGWLAASAAAPPAGFAGQGRGRRLVIDFGGPNVAKPLHVGHLRSFVIGESLRRILQADGWDVVSDIHLGDWGLPMGKLLMGIGNGEGDLSEAYARAHAACAASPEALAQARRLTAALQAGDPEATAAWRTAREASLVPVREAAARLGARFDLFLGESDAAAGAAALSASLRDSGLARLSDGALVTDGPPGSVPVMLAKSDGAATYAATDLATLAHRAAVLRAERIVYCADKRQSGHFEGVFHAARACGLADGVRLEHAGFGTVNGRDGKPYRTREGGTPRLSDLLDEAVSKARARLQAAGLAGAALEEAAEKVGVGAVKHADLSAPRTRGYAFDPDRMTAFEGRTGPYLQYALARISSISERAGREGSAAPDVSTPASRSLALACLAFPGAVTEAAEALEPSSVAAASFGVAQAFSRFYAADRVLGSGALEDSRLALCEAARATLSEGLRLMGMEECARL